MHLLDVVLTLGLIHEQLEAWGLVVLSIIFLELCILFDSRESVCKSAEHIANRLSQLVGQVLIPIGARKE